MKLLQIATNIWNQYKIPLVFIRIIFNFKYKNKNRSSHRKILAQIAEDYTHFLRIFYLVDQWQDAEFDWAVVRGDRYEKAGLKRWFSNFLYYNRITDLKWNLLFTKIFGGKIVFGNYQRWHNQDEVRKITTELYAKVKTREDLIGLMFHDIQVGDLIYDSYLRFKPAAVVDIKDPYVNQLIESCINIFLTFEQLLAKNKYECYISTYATYIDHGISVRLCLKHSVRVICTGNFNQVFVELSKNFPYHKRNFHLYKKWVTSSNKNELIELGKRILDLRFSGQIDTVTSYMKTSAFVVNDQKNPFRFDEKKCIVMAHDFFDSPHVYGNMLFNDYYDWLEFILGEASLSKEYKYYIKPHPNAIKDSVPFYEMLKKHYPHVSFIDPSISNNVIMKSNFRCAFTMIGTVAHELPYGGVPTVSAGDNPHSAFSFCYQAKSKEELSKIIANPELVPQNISLEEIETFVGVHNYRLYKYDIGHFFPWLSEPKDLLKELENKSKEIERKRILNEELKNINQL